LPGLIKNKDSRRVLIVGAVATLVPLLLAFSLILSVVMAAVTQQPDVDIPPGLEEELPAEFQDVFRTAAVEFDVPIEGAVGGGVGGNELRADLAV
jgi:hypothetical protein